MSLSTDIASIAANVSNIGALAAFSFATFCAYWAQETGRNAWLWFVFGLILVPVAGLVLLCKNELLAVCKGLP